MITLLLLNTIREKMNWPLTAPEQEDFFQFAYSIAENEYLILLVSIHVITEIFIDYVLVFLL